jgi:hypothetical protein
LCIKKNGAKFEDPAKKKLEGFQVESTWKGKKTISV